MLLNPMLFLIIIPTFPALLRIGIIQFIVVLLTTLKVLAFIPPNVIALAPVKELPVIVRIFPPLVPPNDGEILVITGGII